MASEPVATNRAAGFGCLGLLVAIGCGLAYACHADEAIQNATFDPAHAIRVTSSDLAQEWDRNEVAAAKKYTDASIIVTGDIGKISGAGDAHPSVDMGSPTLPDVHLIVRSEADALPLQPGQTATFDCVGSRQSLVSVVLDACSLEKGSVNDTSN